MSRGSKFLIFGGVFVSLLNAGTAESVVLQLKWQHQFQFAGYYAAQAQGYYRDAGLEVEIREARPGQDPILPVLRGEADFGVGTSELMLLRGRGEPVVVLAAIFQHSPLVLLARRDAGIDSLHDLVGKRVMIEPQSAELFAYLHNEGVESSAIRVVPHDFKVSALLEHKVAAMSAYLTDEPFLLREAAVDYLIFNPRAGGIDFYGDNLFTTERQLREHPERVRKFREASLRGWAYALRNVDEMIALIRRDYNPDKSTPYLRFEAEHIADLMHTELIEPGHMYAGRWQHMADTYAEFGMLPADFSLEGFVYELNERRDLRWVYWTLGGLSLVALAAWGWVLPLRRLNQRLRREIAEHARTEEALREARDHAEASSAEKSRFIAFITHEVRTPLSGFIGLLDMMRESPLNAEQSETLELMEGSATNMVELISDALEQEKIAAGHLEIVRRPVVLGEMLTCVCDLYRGLIRQRGLHLALSVDEHVPEVVHTDAHRLRQILGNLLGNAIKFTEAGSVGIHVENGPPGCVRILVKDTGRGIDAERAARIFQPYAQGDSLVSHEHGGTGLGLPISRQLARLLGGDLTLAEPKPGGGATFVLEIPLGSPDV